MSGGSSLDFDKALPTQPLILRLEPRPLFRDNRSLRHGEQEVSLASVNDDEVVHFVKERPGTVRIDRVASRRWMICPVLDYTVAAPGGANETDRPSPLRTLMRI